MFRILACVALALVGSLMAAPTAKAQSQFSPVVQVGDAVITRYQLDQRTRFLSLLRAPGDPRNLARDQLVNEAVQLAAARSADIAISPEMLEGGQAEFAARANLSAEEFITALGQNGVEPQTFRDFVQAGLAWREYSRARFGEQARDIPNDQVNRTLARTGTEGGLRVLVSEILLPATTPETTRASRARAAELSQLSTEAEFATAARQFSVSASRANGGALNWRALDGLPEDIRGIIGALSPGQTSRPVELENAIGVFFLRDAERAQAGTPENLTVDYALFRTNGDTATATRIQRRIDTCDDLYGEAQDLSPDVLVREQRPVSDLAPDIRRAITTLDINETTVLARDGSPTVLMLCGRLAGLESGVDFELVGTRLLNARLGALAADHLADLRAQTYIADIVN